MKSFLPQRDDSAMGHRIYTALIVLLVCSSCTTNSKLSEPLFLAGTAWQLVAIQSMDDTQYRPLPTVYYTLQFLEDNRLVVRADCNRGQGSWTQDGPSLLLGPLALTRALCTQSSLHDRFIRDLDYVRSFVTREGDLYLATMADGAILQFSALPMHTLGTINPSFDCSAASGAVEEMICQNEEFALLDNVLDGYYSKALESYAADDLPSLRAFQRGWIKGRNECWKSSDVQACVRQEYELRISELQVKSGALEVPAPAFFRCADAGMVEVYFYADALMPVAVVNAAKNQFLLHQTRAASGARYSDGNTEFWEKGDTALFSTLDGQQDCSAI